MLQKDYEQNEIEVLIFGASNNNNQLKQYFNTIYLGNIKDEVLLAIAYSAADVMVVPSIQEAFGQTASEAMSCATPVVAFGATGLLDIIDHKENGYLAKPYEAEDLANGIKWCFDNNINNTLSEKAREKVLKCFTLEIVAREYKELYNSLLCKNKLDN